jgi:hypothetical protein
VLQLPRRRQMKRHRAGHDLGTQHVDVPVPRVL